MKGLILFIVSVILTAIVFAVSTVFTPIYYIVTLRWKSGSKALNEWFLSMAISLDQFGNGSCWKLLQTVLTKNNAETYDFGNIDETVSFAIGINDRRNNLSMFGRFVRNVLNFIDKNHCEKAIILQKNRDKLASIRFLKNRYA